MASEVSICNVALLRLGHDTITSLSDATRGARVMNGLYAETRDSLLRSHPWNFAVRRVDLALLSDTPTFEFAYQFALPDDCLKVIRTEDEAAGSAYEYRIEGLSDGSRVLLYDSDTCGLEYIAQVTDPNQMDVSFRDAFAARLAAEACMLLTDNATLAKNLWDAAELKLRMAMTADAQEGTPRDIIADEWVRARA